MNRPDIEEVRAWLGLAVQDSGGKEIGRCVRAYTDDETGQTEWLAVRALSHDAAYFVPTREARRVGSAVRVAWRECSIIASPTFGVPDRVLLADEARLYGHYGIPTPAEELDASPRGSGSHALVPAAPRGRPFRAVGAGVVLALTVTGTAVGTTALQRVRLQRQRALARSRRRHLAAALGGLAVPAVAAAVGVLQDTLTGRQKPPLVTLRPALARVPLPTESSGS